MFPSRSALRSGGAFAHDLTTHGDRVALVDGEVELTFGELDIRVDEMADRLGTERRLVLLSASNDVESVVTYLAALRAGHPILLSGDAPGSVADLIESYDPDVVASSAEGRWRLDERRSGSRHSLHPDLALLLSTSGSTGSRKLVRLSHRNLEANADAIVRFLGIGPEDRAATTLPMQYCYGLSVINSHLRAGAGVILTNLSVLDVCFWDHFRDAAGTTFAAVPHTFDLLERVGFEDFRLPSLRYVTQAGGRLRPELVRKYAQLGRRDGWDLCVMYGQTEATARMAYLPPERALTHPAAIGIAIPGGHLGIEPFEGAPPGAGELVYRGANVMLGYATEAADLALGATVDRLHTGDVARQLDDGMFEIIGRRSRFAKLFGLRVDLDEIERLLDDDGIRALCASDDQRLVVATTSPADARRAAPLVAARAGLPPGRVSVVVRDELPRLANGKPDYASLAMAAPPNATTPAGPSTVHDVFAAMLGCRTVMDDDTFVSLGGDSLSYVETSIHLEELLGALPDAWHLTPVGELTTSTGRRRRSASIETNVALRAVAIVLVVANHTRAFSLPGGAHVLLGIAGFNFARFTLASGAWWRSAARIVIPSACWIGVAAALTAHYDLQHALLLNGWIGGTEDRQSYWFIEALVQILLVVGAVLSVPALRRTQQRRPFEFGLALTLVALTVRFELVPLPTMSDRVIRPHEILWIFGIGWAGAHASTTRQRLVISGIIAAAVPGFFGRTDREIIIATGLLLLVWVTHVRVPWPLNRLLGHVAAASLYVYLTHWQIYPPVRSQLGAPAATAGSVLAGVAVWSLAKRVAQARARTRRPRPRDLTSAIRPKELELA